MTILASVRRLAERTPPGRDRYVDLLRAVAIGAVVVGHWLAVVVAYDDETGFTGRNVLEVVGWSHPLTWLFQVMPVFFLVGGFANAASFTSGRRQGGTATGWLLDRTDRLLRPTTVFLVVIGAAAAAAHALGAKPGLLGTGVWLATLPLWFLVAYLAVVVLTPPMHALHRRAGLAVPVVLAVLVGAGDLARLGLDAPAAGQVNFLFAWLAVHQLGFAWQDGRLPARPRVGVPLAAGGLAALVLLTVAGPYPVSMVAVPGAEVQNTSPPTLALLALATAQTGVALALHDRGDRRLRRAARAWTAVVGVNAVILTVFLWHMTAVVIGALAVYPTGLWTPRPAGSVGWLWERPPWLALLAVVLTVLVALFGRFEIVRGRRPGDGRRAPLRTGLTIAGLAAALAGLFLTASAGPEHRGPLGLPAGAAVTYLLGVAVLWLARRRGRPAA